MSQGTLEVFHLEDTALFDDENERSFGGNTKTLLLPYLQVWFFLVVLTCLFYLRSKLGECSGEMCNFLSAVDASSWRHAVADLNKPSRAMVVPFLSGQLGLVVKAKRTFYGVTMDLR